MLLENVGPGKPLGEISNEQLRRFGGALSFYSGIPGLFADLKSNANEHPRSIPQVEFYVISGGLEEIIEGRKAWKLAKPRRTIGVNTPSYTEDDPLGSCLRMAVREMCVKMEIRTGDLMPD